MMRTPAETEVISPQLRRAFTFIVPAGFNHPKTRTHVRLLGPCFKTGRMKPYDRQQPKHIVCIHASDSTTKFKRTACSPLWLRHTEKAEASPKGHVLRHLCRIRVSTSQAITLIETSYLLARRITRFQHLLTHTDGKCDNQYQVTNSNGPFGSVRGPYRAPIV